jgi:hypothetical protein
MQTNQSATAPHMGIANSIQWMYNPMIRIILHKSHKCKLCAEWAHYYAYSALDSETSLSYAEAQHETIIHTTLAAKHATLQQHHSTLQQTHDAL